MNKATAVPNKSLKNGPFCQGLAQDDRIKITHPLKNDPDKSPFILKPRIIPIRHRWTPIKKPMHFCFVTNRGEENIPVLL